MFASLDLKRVLFDEYNGFADKRIKKLEKGSRFIVDDRRASDLNARNELFPWFCRIFVEVIDGNEVLVFLDGGVPEGRSVSAWLTRNGLQLQASTLSNRLEFRVTRDSLDLLASLATAFKDIVRPGAPRYKEAAYKYVCPRTAASLGRLQNVLQAVWRVPE